MSEPFDIRLEAWEHQFRTSAHPLAKAIRSFIWLDDLIVTNTGVDYLYSISTLDLIREARSVSEAHTLGTEPHPIVDLVDVEAALICRVHSGRGSYEIERALLSRLDFISRAALRRRESRYTPERQTATEGWLIGPDLTAALGLAAYMAGIALPSAVPTVDLWQFVLAGLALPKGRQIFFTELIEASVPATAFFDLVSGLMDALKSKPPPGFRELPESGQQGWFTILDQLSSETIPAVLPQAFPTRPDYAPDKPIEGRAYDILNFRDDIAAVAELVCLRKPGPPLAFGLFGDWGSGKSSFMKLLEAEVETLTSQARSTPNDETFIKRAIHIQFNAWHYNDTDLWPALANEVFSQLRAGGAGGRRAALGDALLRELNSKVSTWSSQADQSAEQLVISYSEARSIEKELAEIEDTRARQMETARSTVAKELVEAVSKVPSAKSLLDLYNTEAWRSGAEQDESVQEADVTTQGLPEHIVPVLQDATILKVAKDALGSLGKQSDLRTILLFWILPLAGVLAFLVLQVDFQPTLILGLTKLGAIAAAIGGPLTWLVQTVRPFLKVAADYRAEQSKAMERYRREAGKIQDKLRKKRQEIRTQEENYQKNMAQAARFGGRSPQQLLDFFLAEGSAVKALKDDVGVISRVRHAFEQLNQVLSPKEPPACRGEVPEVVILYIDDLDRCRAEQVVRVLEAVHLLLAFDRFVVVVGVDTRWLETSLLAFFEHQLRTANHVQNEDLRPRATARDYLEKIFQIPIQLKRLTYGKDGSFPRLVDALSGLVRAEEPGPKDGGVQQPERVKAYGRAQPIAQVSVEVAEPARFAEALERARLREQEVKLLEKLGPIAGRSPRAVKRLLNLYRLFRATRSGSTFDRFIRDAGKGNRPDGTAFAEFPAIQFWLAVEVGQSTEQIHRLRQVILKAADDECTEIKQVFAIARQNQTLSMSQTADVEQQIDAGGPGEFAQAAHNVSSVGGWVGIFNDFLENLSPEIDRKEFAAALEAIQCELPTGRAGIDMLRDALTESARYSFVPLSRYLSPHSPHQVPIP